MKSLGVIQGQGKLWRHKKKNGDIIFVEVTFYPISYFGKTASQAQMQDVTERMDLQKKLDEQRISQQKQITAAVLEAQEREREYIGEELHDNINQMLASSKLYLEHAKTHPETKNEMIDRSRDVVTMAIEEIRKLSKKLIVSEIKQSEESGLKELLQDMIANILSVTKINISLKTEGFDEKGLADAFKITLYRIVQEQLTNILKHAEAESVIINLQRKDGVVNLEVSDNGKGFDPSKKRKGVGITNMTSRVSLYDGEVKIHSAPGKGCTVKISLHEKKQ